MARLVVGVKVGLELSMAQFVQLWKGRRHVINMLVNAAK